MSTNYTYADELDAFANIIKKDCATTGATISIERDYINDTTKLTCKVCSGKIWHEMMENGCDEFKSEVKFPEIEKVVFNGPATVVFWSDATKTVVKKQPDDQNPYSKELGLALCFAKKAMGNKGAYYDTFKKWCENPNDKYENMTFGEVINEFEEFFKYIFGGNSDD